VRARIVAAASLLLLAACSGDQANPFAAPSRPASADSVAMFVSSSWATQPGEPRELLAVNADGSRTEQLTSCAQAEQPCDFLQFAISPERERIAAVRSIPGAAPGASALYFMDLGRSLESQLFPQRRVTQVDWAPNGSLLLYASPGDASNGVERLFLCQPNGAQDQTISASTGIHERGARFAPSSQTAVFERFDADGVSRVYIYADTPVTAGPASGALLEGSPYFLGADADPVFAPDGSSILFRRLSGLGNAGLGIWDLLVVNPDGSGLRTLAEGAVYRSAADWGPRGILFVETDAAAMESRLVLVQADGSGRTVLRTENAAFGMGSPRWIPGS
jgi:Tol biopolymer transport system component